MASETHSARRQLPNGGHLHPRAIQGNTPGAAPDLNARIVAATAISPDDLVINLLETPAENLSFSKGLAQRVGAVIAP